MRVLISGGTGFIGQSLCLRVVAAGHEVLIQTRQSTRRLPQSTATFVIRLEEVAA